jgi:signal transduction histidine kinase
MEVFNYIAFAVTVILALISVAIAFFIYANNKKDFMNVAYALFLIFFAAWLVSGFAEKILVTPGDEFTTWTFRWANATVGLALLFYLLFLLAFYRGRSPKRGALAFFLLLGGAIVFMSLSPWGIESAHYGEGSLTSRNGPLYMPLMLIFIAICAAILCLAILKWRKSTGIDRARMNLILLGFAPILPFGLTFSVFLPVLTDNYSYTNYTFIASVLPATITAYSLIRHRLLDVRVVLRKTGVFLLFILALGAPVIAVAAILSNIDMSRAAQTGLLCLIFVAALAVAPSLWEKLEAYSSRIFFSGLYDPGRLKEAVSVSLSATTDIYEGIPLILKLLVLPLGLERLGLLILPGVIDEPGVFFECRRAEDDRLVTETQAGFSFLDRIRDLEESAVTEEWVRWPRSAEEKALGELLSQNGIRACIPLRTRHRVLGHFLVGEKVNRQAFLGSTDIRCLEDIGLLVGLHVDNQSLSAQLKRRVQELERVYGELKAADDFKAEIINVTSHELRTPLTILNSFTQILMERYDASSKEERLEYLEYIKDACRRLISVVSQFSTVSGLQKGTARTHPEPISVDELFREVKSSFRDRNGERVEISVQPPGMRLESDYYYLSLMLKNLIENGLRFSSDTDPVLLRAEGGAGKARLSVRDFGEGIAPEMAGKIFDPFTRLEELDKHHQGTGLGLYAVQLIASLLGTEVGVESVPDQGTTFFFELPLLEGGREGI